jgi:hypothetical protein
MTKISDRELEVLSAYLDGEVSHKDRERIESRLSDDEGLRENLEQLQQTRAMIRSLPKLRSPRNFLLTPEMVGQVREPRRLFPVFRLATALATVLFIFFLFGDYYLVRNPPLSGRVAMQSLEASDQFAAPPVLESELYESQAPEAALGEAIEEMPAEEEARASEPGLEAAQPAEQEADMEKAILTVSPTLEAALNDEAEGEIQAQQVPLAPADIEVTPTNEVEAVSTQAEESQAIYNFIGIVRIVEIVLILVIISTGLFTFFLFLRERSQG